MTFLYAGCVTASLFAAGAALDRPAQQRGAPSGARIAGIDHVPVVVADLEAAADRFQRLGFVLPRAHQRVDGRPIVGMTVLVRDLEAARRFAQPATERGGSLFVAPDATAGFWLELRQR